MILHNMCIMFIENTFAWHMVKKYCFSMDLVLKLKREMHQFFSGNLQFQNLTHAVKILKTGTPKIITHIVFEWNTVELQWLEHWWLVYHGYFELVPGFLRKRSPTAADIIVFGIISDDFFSILKKVCCVYSVRCSDISFNLAVSSF